MARALELEDKKNINIKNIKILEQEFLLTLKEQLDFGVGFSAALKNSQNKKFKLIKLTGYLTPLILKWVYLGELTSSLETRLLELADWEIRKLKIKKKIKKAVFYPSLILATTGLVLWLLIGLVIPSFEKMFLSQKLVLPPLTQAVLLFSDFLVKYGVWLGVGLFLSGALSVFLIQNNLKINLIFSKFILSCPGFCFLNYHGNMRYLFGLLTMAQSAGLPLYEAVNLAASSISNPILQTYLQQTCERLTEGWSLSQALGESGYFSLETLSYLQQGERSGLSHIILKNLAERSDFLWEERVDFWLKLLEPALMLIISFLVGSVVVAMYWPMFELGKNI